jgi:hypothetical protein
MELSMGEIVELGAARERRAARRVRASRVRAYAQVYVDAEGRTHMARSMSGEGADALLIDALLDLVEELLGEAGVTD